MTVVDAYAKQRAKKVAEAREATKRPGRTMDLTVRHADGSYEWMRFECGAVAEYAYHPAPSPQGDC